MSDEIYSENWFGPHERDAMQWALAQVESEGAYIEIGSFEGKSTVFLANAIYPKVIDAVDTWQGGPVADYEQMKYASYPIEDTFKHNIRVATQQNVRVNKMDWHSFFDTFDREIAFLYLDGPHDKQSVIESLEIIIPLLAPGGVIVGDDYDDLEVSDAVIEYFGQGMSHPKLARHFYYKKPKV